VRDLYTFSVDSVTSYELGGEGSEVPVPPTNLFTASMADIVNRIGKVLSRAMRLTEVGVIMYIIIRKDGRFGDDRSVKRWRSKNYGTRTRARSQKSMNYLLVFLVRSPESNEYKPRQPRHK
jgi:hypothetical protein